MRIEDRRKASIMLWISAISIILTTVNSFYISKRILDRVYSLKISVRNIKAALPFVPITDIDLLDAADIPLPSTSSVPLPPHIVALKVAIRLLLINDGNRTAFIDRLDIRLDALTPQDTQTYFSDLNLVPKTPHQFETDETPTKLRWVRDQNEVKRIRPSFPLVLKPDDLQAVLIDGTLCFENNKSDNSTLRLPAKISIGVTFVDTHGRIAGKSFFGGLICLFESPRSDPHIRKIVNDKLQIVFRENFMASLYQRTKAKSYNRLILVYNHAKNTFKMYVKKLGRYIAKTD